MWLYVAYGGLIMLCNLFRHQASRGGEGAQHQYGSVPPWPRRPQGRWCRGEYGGRGYPHARAYDSQPRRNHQTHTIRKSRSGRLKVSEFEKKAVYGKEGRNWALRRFQQLRSYRDEIETRNREEIPYSSRIVPRGLSVAERP